MKPVIIRMTFGSVGKVVRVDQRARVLTCWKAELHRDIARSAHFIRYAFGSSIIRSEYCE